MALEGHLHFELLPLEPRDSTFLLFKMLSLWCFVIAFVQQMNTGLSQNSLPGQWRGTDVGPRAPHHVCSLLLLLQNVRHASVSPVSLFP